MSKVSVDATDLRSCSASEALSFADKVLGDAASWDPSLIGYRLQSSFQEDWKTEVGSWLVLAERCGFLASLLKRLGRAFHEAAAPEVTGPNDSAHRILMSELAPAMVTYYFVASGWTFVEWEPPVAVGDVDVRLKCPLGVLTDIQVKAPDQPGENRGSLIHDGERDERVLAAIDKGLVQLSHAVGPQRMVVVSPQRVFPIEARILAAHLLGRTEYSQGSPTLTSARRGAFARSPGVAVGAVVDLTILRGVDETLYRCTTFLNPWATANATPSPAAFRNSRVCRLDGNIFTWEPEPPERCFSLPSGTVYVASGDGV